MANDLSGSKKRNANLDTEQACSKRGKTGLSSARKKYKPGLLCPGSFFKNIILKNLKPSVRKKLTERIDNSKIIYGKVPSGYLLEEVGAKGMSVGGIRVAKHHGNLIYNSGGGKERDVKKLAGILKGLVSKKFGVRLEEEVQYL